MRFFDPGNVADFFVHNIERVDSMGSTSRIVFCTPKSDRGETVNESVLSLIVPTDQLAGMVGKLMQAPSASITRKVESDEVLH
ncbi:MAG: hypothetical protein Q8M18_10930 [Bradyrhizobium sp.]|nr:hypothetical protein [Bradyrhizobium sp.]